MTDVRPIVRDFLLAECMPGDAAAELRDDQALMTSGILDSISVLRLVTLLEEKTGIEVEASDVEEENFGTIDAIVRFVAARATAGG